MGTNIARMDEDLRGRLRTWASAESCQIAVVAFLSPPHPRLDLSRGCRSWVADSLRLPVRSVRHKSARTILPWQGSTAVTMRLLWCRCRAV